MAGHLPYDRLIQSIDSLSSKAFDPANAQNTSKTDAARRELDDLLQRANPTKLLQALTTLVRPGKLPEWQRTKLWQLRSRTPMRPDGVWATLEFIFAVDPSSSRAGRSGSNITPQSLDLVRKAICTIPKSVVPETWYSAISPQLLALLGGTRGRDLARVAADIIGRGILGDDVKGKPGGPGWQHLVQAMWRYISPRPHELPALTAALAAEDEKDGIIDLQKERVLVTSVQLCVALHRLLSLLNSYSESDLSRKLLWPLRWPLLALSTWPGPENDPSMTIRSHASKLLEIYLKLAASPAILLCLARSPGYRGGCHHPGFSKNPAKETPLWMYKATANGALEIVTVTNDSYPTSSLSEVERKCSRLIDIVSDTFPDKAISASFIKLFGRWMKSSQIMHRVSILVKEEVTNGQDPLQQLVELQMLQGMMEKFPDKLAGQPRHLLDLASQVLASDGMGEDNLAVALSIVNVIITAPGFRKSKVDPDVLRSIESSLERISQQPNENTSQTATNLVLLLKHRDDIEDSSESIGAPTDGQVEDRKTYSLAISYISEKDSPPPVRSEGINLLWSLIKSQSPVLDITGVLVLASSVITDREDYVNLQAIKIFTLLADRHPRAVTNELIDRYVDPKETATVDSRLRFGEALLQVIERLGEAFTGQVAKHVGEALLAVAGRRGHRPKTERRQARDEKKRQMQKAQTNRAPELDDEDEDGDGDGDGDGDSPVPEEEKARNRILAQIVQGWESSKGAEDVRVRASALSVLAGAVEVSIGGLGATLATGATDLCVAVLQLEREPEKGILRRAAVSFVMSFICALDGVRQAGKMLGFGLGDTARKDLMRILGYVAQTDGDGLVQQHARDVLESLEHWQANMIIQPEKAPGLSALGPGLGLPKLAGLAINPERSAADKSKIEEIE